MFDRNAAKFKRHRKAVKSTRDRKAVGLLRQRVSVTMLAVRGNGQNLRRQDLGPPRGHVMIDASRFSLPSSFLRTYRSYTSESNRQSGGSGAMSGFACQEFNHHYKGRLRVISQFPNSY